MLQPLDLALLAGYLVVVVVVGLAMGRGTRDVSAYTVGSRNAPWWLVLLSIVATETSTVTFLSVPGIAFSGDLRWLQLPMGYVVGRLLVVSVLLPLYFRGELFTAYEVLERRFGVATKRTASAVFLVTRNLSDGLRLFLTAIVLQEVAGIDLATAVVLIGVATVLYTFVGGIRAVLWTDAIQFAIYMIGAVVAFWLVCDRVPGGFAAILERADAAGKLRLFDFDFDLGQWNVFWAGLIGGAFLSLGTHGADQMMVQRYLCARSQRAAGLALGLSGVVVFAQFAVFMLLGTALWAFYTDHPPAEPFASDDRVLVTFVVSEVPSGLLGLLLGAVFAAAMSTCSSSLNASATTLVHDLWAPLRHGDDTARLRWTRRATILFGGVQIAVGIGAQAVDSAIVNAVLAVAGFATGLLLGLFFLGAFTRRVDQRAALVGLLAGLAAVSWVAFGTAVAWPWYSLVGAATTFAVGLAVSRPATPG